MNLSPNGIHLCLICQQKLQYRNYVPVFNDYYCNQEDHHLSYRVKEDLNGDYIMTKMRIRLTDENDSVVRLKIHYDLGYSEVWKLANSIDRIRIDSIVIPDFTDLAKLKNKLKTFIVFG